MKLDIVRLHEEVTFPGNNTTKSLTSKTHELDYDGRLIKVGFKGKRKSIYLSPSAWAWFEPLDEMPAPPPPKVSK